MNGIDFPVERCSTASPPRSRPGLTPVKVNMVVRRGINEASIVPMAALGARDRASSCASSNTWTSGHSNGWRLDEVVPAAELVEQIARDWPVEPRRPALSRRGRRPLALCRWRRRVRGHLVGHASRSVGDCTRARLSAEGKLYTCLFAVDGHDLRAVAPRSGATDEDADRVRRRIWRAATTATRSCGRAATADAAPGSRCSRWAAEPASVRPTGHVSSTRCPQRRSNSWTRRRRRARFGG